MLHSYESKLRNQTFSESLMKSENTLPVQIFKQADKWCNAMNAKCGSILILKNYHCWIQPLILLSIVFGNERFFALLFFMYMYKTVYSSTY